MNFNIAIFIVLLCLVGLVALIGGVNSSMLSTESKGADAAWVALAQSHDGRLALAEEFAKNETVLQVEPNFAPAVEAAKARLYAARETLVSRTKSTEEGKPDLIVWKSDFSEVDRAELEAFDEAQRRINVLLQQLMIVADATPVLRTAQFQAIRAKLADTNSTIAANRATLVKNVSTYNNSVRFGWPSQLLASRRGLTTRIDVSLER